MAKIPSFPKALTSRLVGRIAMGAHLPANPRSAELMGRRSLKSAYFEKITRYQDYDLNRDGKVDLTVQRTFDQNTGKLLDQAVTIKKRSGGIELIRDSNGDGRIDILRSSTRDTFLSLEDRDRDGRVDTRYASDKRGAVVDYDDNRDGRPDRREILPPVRPG